MSDFKVHILGCGSALPTQRHLPTSQVVELRGKLYLVDCGEGTQRQIRCKGLSFEALTTIFITHHHGDHIFGLPGLLSSLSMLGRTRALTIIGPRGTKKLIEGMRTLFLDWIAFPLSVEEFDDRVPQQVFMDRSVVVRSVPLMHRMPCQGYVFEERVSERRVDKASCQFYGVPLAHYPALLRGEDWTNDDGEVIVNARLTKQLAPARSYAMCTDTLYLPHLHEFIKGVTLLYHEATFLRGSEERAKQTCHSTAYQAAEVAKAAGVGRLVIGHYSARHNKIEPFRSEATEVFPNTIAADEGLTIEL